jgi:tRNA(fMet)-specific endonuclease VapC
VAVKYLLDTNTCIHYLRHGADSPIAARLAGVPQGEVALCSVVVAELLYGALRSRDKAKNLADVRRFAAGFPSVPFGDLAAEEYATVKADLAARGMLIGPNDLLIAAIALVHRLTLLTHNTAEFRRVASLTLEDWLAPAPSGPGTVGPP